MIRKTKEEVLEEFRCGSIQDAAMRVIARKGIEETTIQDIADEAGIAKGTIYVYFRDREELLSRTADRLFEQLLTELAPAFTAENTFEARIHGLVTRQLRFFDEHRALFRATLALSQRDGEHHKTKTRSFIEYMARVEQLFTDAHDAGEIRDIDPLTVAAIYRDFVRGVIVRRLDPKGQKTRRSAEEDAEMIVSVFLHGLLAGDR
jgi:AcrR family transcriptional regulator